MHRNAAQRSFGGIVRQADAAVVEEAGEGRPALEHVIHGLGDVVVARELGALLAHPALQVGDQRCAELLADSPALLGALAIDRALDLEQGVDAPDRLQRQRRDRRRRFALRLAAGILGDIGHDEERATGVDPTRGLQDRARACDRARTACCIRRRRRPGKSRHSRRDGPAGCSPVRSRE